MKPNDESHAAPALQGVLETCLYVDNLDAAERFYGEVLQLCLESKQEGRHVFFYCGNQMLLLFAPEVSDAVDAKMPRHGARGAGHVAFRATAAEVDSWIERLKSRGVEVESIIEWPGGQRSVYFRDPAGNSLEIASAAIWGFPETVAE